MWYSLALRIAGWRAFGVEQIEIENGVFSWTRTALFWVRKLEVPVAEIHQVKGITSWHALNNHVDLILGTRCAKIGDQLLTKETDELAWHLQRAIQNR